MTRIGRIWRPDWQEERVTLEDVSPQFVIPTFRLRPPRTPRGLIARPLVTGSLLATDPGAVSIVAAATGYGATTAVQQALGGSVDDLCWVGLDQSVGDEDARLLLQAAVGSESAEISDLVASLSGSDSTWLVVDGLDPTRHQGLAAELAALATDMPSSARLIITTHTRFDLAGARQFDESLLAFAKDDAFDLVRHVAPEADVDEVSAVIDVAAGWVSALVAGAQHLATHGAAGDWLRESGPGELLKSWYDGLTADQRRLLEQTSVLDVLGEGPVARITGSSDAGASLSDLEAAHAFLMPCEQPSGQTGRWWRRHPMLTTLLRQRAGVDTSASHAAAADWFIESGDVISALSHLIACGRLKEAAVMLTDNESTLLSTGEAHQVVHWDEKFASAQGDRVEGLLRTAWGLALARDIAGAEAAAARLRAHMVAVRATGVSAEVEQTWESDEALLAAYLASFHGNPAAVIAGARKSMETLPSGTSRDAAQLAPILLIRGLLWSGQTEAAADAMERLNSESFVNDVLRELHLASLRALVNVAAGYVREADDVLRGIDVWVENGGVEPWSIQLFAPDLARAWVRWDSADIGAVEDVCKRVLEAAQSIRHLSDATWACLLLAKAEMARGDLGAAMRILSRGRALSQSQTTDSSLAIPLDQTQARVHIAAGDLVRAERLIRRLPPSDARALLSARAGLARQPVLSRRTLEAVTPKTPRVAAERHMLLSALHAKTSRRMAQGHLREAAEISATHGMRQLLSHAPAGVMDLAAETALEFGDENLEWLLGTVRAEALASAEIASTVTLSRGELQLLAILPTRAKNAEIAQRLGVSVNTVKTRLRRLYAKLSAANRDEAIAIASERGLLQ